jgi:carboxyl-terminal processing protease
LIRIEYIDTGMIQENLAYIRLRGFPEPSVADRFERFLDQLPQTNARALIIDLRGNSGGRVDLGTRLLNRFISSGPLYSQVDRTGQRRVEHAHGPGWSRPMPVAILIDEATASMGEIFASAMRERGLAWLVGKRTSGNVAAAQVFPLSDGSAVQVTILEIFSGDGQRLNRVGVEPDFVIEPTPEQVEQGRDVQLEAAVVHVWEELDRAAGQPAPGQ